MIEKLLELWYAIPREKEWWFDQIAKVISGCFTGCSVFFLFWLLSTMLTTSITVSFFARNFNEGLSMGLAWGCPLGLASAFVGGSLVLSLISRAREE